MSAEVWLSLSRRKMRASLSALGVAAGIFAMELIASVSQHFRMTSRQFQENFSGRIFVCERLSFWSGGGVLSDAKTAKVEAVAGVSKAVPLLVGRLLPERLIVLGVPEVMVGLPPEDAEHLWPEARLRWGRWLRPGDAGVIIGSDVATLLNAHPDGQVSLLGRTVPVIGLLAPSGTLVDRQVLTPMALAQDIMGRDGLITGMVVEPTAVSSPTQIAEAIRQSVAGVQVIAPKELEGDVQRSVAVWDAIAAVLGLGAALAGSATVSVTTLVAVHERVAEIGIRRAIGASRGQIFTEFLAETWLLTLLGWLVGTAAVLLFVHLADPWLQSVGAAIFDVNGVLVVGSLVVASVLGLLAGAGPAWMATRVDVLAALRRV